jgi:hypothetical protein
VDASRRIAVADIAADPFVAVPFWDADNNEEEGFVES